MPSIYGRAAAHIEWYQVPRPNSRTNFSSSKSHCLILCTKQHSQKKWPSQLQRSNYTQTTTALVCNSLHFVIRLANITLGAHRAHIALAELGLPYEEEIIDLYVPRTPEFLKVNPRGLVPTLEFDGEIIAESAIVATFLADAFPSNLWPASTDPQGPITRSKINFFTDAYFSRAQGHWAKLLVAKSENEQKASVAAYIDCVAKDVDPLLVDAGPFFGGSNTLTLAEVRG